MYLLEVIINFLGNVVGLDLNLSCFVFCLELAFKRESEGFN